MLPESKREMAMTGATGAVFGILVGALLDNPV
jgi:hypothetical protein